MIKQSCLCSVAVSLSLAAGVAFADDPHAVKILRTTGDTGVTKPLVQGWMEQAVAIAVHDDSEAGLSDIACTGFSMTIDGDIGEIGLVPKAIQTEQQYEALRKIDTKAFLVLEKIEVCGKNKNGTYNFGDYSGCEVTSGPMLLVTSHPSQQLTLIHEAGHRVGLHHTWPTSDCSPQKPAKLSELKYRNIMYCQAHKKRLFVTSSDCNALRSGNLSAEVSALQVEMVAPAINADANAQTDEKPAARVDDVIDFLTYDFATAVPVDEAKALTQEQVQQVRDVLSEAQSELWGTAALALGLAGNESDVDFLTRFIARIAADTSGAALRAKTDAGIAIGYLGGQFGESVKVRALRYLLPYLYLQNAAQIAPGDDAPILANSFARAVAYTGEPASGQILVDLSAASNGVMVDYSTTTPAKNQGPIIMDRESASVLAGISVDVHNRGLIAHLKSPQPVDSPLSTLKTLAEAVPFSDPVSEMLQALGLASGFQ